MAKLDGSVGGFSKKDTETWDQYDYRTRAGHLDMITLRVGSTMGVETKGDAKKFIRDHVVIKRKDLNRIAKIAKKHGFFNEIVALEIDMHELHVADGGDW